MYGTNAAGPALAVGGAGFATLGWGVAAVMTAIATVIAVSVFVPRFGRRASK
jgi:membrane protein implicated in regulation of membrane protease activity